MYCFHKPMVIDYKKLDKPKFQNTTKRESQAMFVRITHGEKRNYLAVKNFSRLFHEITVKPCK